MIDLIVAAEDINVVLYVDERPSTFRFVIDTQFPAIRIFEKKEERERREEGGGYEESLSVVGTMECLMIQLYPSARRSK